MSQPFTNRTGMFLSLIAAIVLSLLIGMERQKANPGKGIATEIYGERGSEPWVFNIALLAVANPEYLNTRWTGEHLQMVLMSLKPGETIDPDIHNAHDQFIRIEQGEAEVVMGKQGEDFAFEKNVMSSWAIFIPAGYWYQIRNTGNTDLKLFTIYAPSGHSPGTILETYQQARVHNQQKD